MKNGKIGEIFMLHCNFFYYQNDLNNVREMIETLEHAEIPLDTMVQFVHGYYSWGYIILDVKGNRNLIFQYMSVPSPEQKL